MRVLRSPHAWDTRVTRTQQTQKHAWKSYLRVHACKKLHTCAYYNATHVLAKTPWHCICIHVACIHISIRLFIKLTFITVGVVEAGFVQKAHQQYNMVSLH